MPILTLPTTLFEGTTALYSFELVDEAGTGIASAQLNTLTLTYFDVLSGAIINNREAQDVTNENDVTLATDTGPPLTTVISWLLQPEDTVILDQTRRLEVHEVQFRWTWDAGRRSGAHVVCVCIENLAFSV